MQASEPLVRKLLVAARQSILFEAGDRFGPVENTLLNEQFDQRRHLLRLGGKEICQRGFVDHGFSPF